MLLLVPQPALGAGGDIDDELLDVSGRQARERWGSAGIVGFKGTRKSTPFAAQRASEHAAQAAMRHGLKEVVVKVRGAGSGRDSAVRALSNSGLTISSIEDVTPLPHNGCRARKRRRV